eukprot:363824-Chlamydomonas_euryale.AAC.14
MALGPAAARCDGGNAHPPRPRLNHRTTDASNHKHVTDGEASLGSRASVRYDFGTHHCRLWRWQRPPFPTIVGAATGMTSHRREQPQA